MAYANSPVVESEVIQPAPVTAVETATQDACECSGDPADRSNTLGDLATLASVLSVAFYLF